MTLSGRLLCGSFCAALMLTAGCGKDDKETARFNESIGGRGPITVSGLDPGLLQDPSSYKPASAGGGALGSGGETGAAKDAGGEADAAEKAVTGVVDSLASSSAAGILDSFDPAEVKALADGGFAESLQGTFDAFGIVSSTYKAKVSDAEKTAMSDLPGQLTKLAADAIEVTIVDADNAIATIDPSKIKAWAMEMASKAAPPPTAPGNAPAPESHSRVQAPGDTPAPPTDPSSPAPPAGSNSLAAMLGGNAGQDAAPASPVNIPLKKIDGKWRIALGRTIGQELADVLKEGCDLTRESLVQVNGRIDAVPANDPQAMQNALMSMLPSLMGPYTGWFQRLQTALAENDAAVAGAEKKPAVGEKKDEPPTSPGIINP